ncbi:hypothetical protein RB213_007879 [Colletotrichum asianum]
MKVLSLSMLFVTFICVASALPQTPGTGCDSVALCNELCGKQGKKRGGSACTGNNAASCVCVPK